MAKATTTSPSTTDDNEEDINKDRFRKRYVKSLAGLLHGILSLSSCILATLLFLNYLVSNLKYESLWSHKDMLALPCFGLTFAAATITATAFWDQVQNWQLATTSLKEKGISALEMKHMNQGRGVVVPLVFSFYPLVLRLASKESLESQTLSAAVALVLLAGSMTSFALIRAYKVQLFLVYGGYTVGLGLALLWETVVHGGSIASIHAKYPHLQSHLELEASFVIACVQYGFLWYYAYSRKLVSKEQVQTLCKGFHIPVLAAVLLRRGVVEASSFWTLVPPMVCMHAGVYPLLIFIKLSVAAMTNIGEKILSYSPTSKQQQQQSAVSTTKRQPRRRSSLVSLE